MSLLIVKQWRNLIIGWNFTQSTTGKVAATLTFRQIVDEAIQCASCMKDERIALRK